MEYKDYYKILGVSKKASDKEIKQAYRKLAREYHPDKNRDNRAAEEEFKAINEAYQVLGNPQNRARYDQLGHNYHRYQQMGGNPADFDFSQWFGSGSAQNMEDMFAGGGFSDFFSQIFGSGTGPQRRRRPRPDIEHTVEISLLEAYHGTQRTISRGREEFSAKIPAGAKTGTKIRLRGKGNYSPNGVGDLFLLVKVKPDHRFKREGQTLKVTVVVDVLTAVLGGKAELPTLTGTVNLTIPAGTQGGQTFRLKGKGMPNLRQQESFGDLLATVTIRVPKELSAAEQEHYEQLRLLSQTPDPA